MKLMQSGNSETVYEELSELYTLKNLFVEKIRARKDSLKQILAFIRQYMDQLKTQYALDPLVGESRDEKPGIKPWHHKISEKLKKMSRSDEQNKVQA